MSDATMPSNVQSTSRFVDHISDTQGSDVRSHVTGKPVTVLEPEIDQARQPKPA